MQSLEGKQQNLEINLFRNWQPMKMEEDGSDVITLPRACYLSTSCILNRLKLFDDIFRDIIQQRISVIQFGSYKGVNKNISIVVCVDKYFFIREKADLQTLLAWGSIDIVVSKISPIFLAFEEGLITSVPKRSGVRDCCGLYFENKQRSSVLTLFSFSLLMDIHLSMSERHSFIYLFSFT